MVKKPVAKKTAAKKKIIEPEPQVEEKRHFEPDPAPAKVGTVNIYEKSWKIFISGETGFSTKLSTINYLLERALKEERGMYMEAKMIHGKMHYYVTLLQDDKTISQGEE